MIVAFNLLLTVLPVVEELPNKFIVPALFIYPDADTLPWLFSIEDELSKTNCPLLVTVLEPASIL